MKTIKKHWFLLGILPPFSIFVLFFSKGELHHTAIQALMGFGLMLLIAAPVVLVRIFLSRRKLRRMKSEIGEKGYTKLMWAACANNATMLLDEIENGSDVNHQDDGGATALMYSANYGAEECAALLMKNGAKTDLVTNDGSSAKDYAKHKSHKTIEKMLS